MWLQYALRNLRPHALWNHIEKVTLVDLQEQGWEPML